MNTRTDSSESISKEQLRELITAVGQHVPTNISKDQYRKIVEAKGRLDFWLELILNCPLKNGDLDRVWAVLYERNLEISHFWFGARSRLEKTGFQIVNLPKTTLRELWGKPGLFKYTCEISQNDVEELDLDEGEVAWNPKDPYVFGNFVYDLGEKFEEEKRYNTKFGIACGQLSIIPSLEQIVALAIALQEQKSFPDKGLHTVVRNKLKNGQMLDVIVTRDFCSLCPAENGPLFQFYTPA